jgi:hypothetical protein
MITARLVDGARRNGHVTLGQIVLLRQMPGSWPATVRVVDLLL